MYLESILRRSDIFTGRYLFHFHTQHTDGELSIEDYFVYAAKMSVDRLIFLEHIRRQPTYDVQEFATNIARASQKFGIDAVLGFEAKLLVDGDLDISDEHFALAKVIGMAEHGFPHDTTSLQNSLRQAVERYRSAPDGKILVWVHPGLTFRKAGLNPANHAGYRSMVQWAQQKRLLVEENLRHGLVPESMFGALDREAVVLGTDAHNMTDLERWRDHT